MVMLGLAAGGLLVACEQKEEPTPSGAPGTSDRVTAPSPGTETLGETVDETAGEVREAAEDAADDAAQQAEELKAQAVAAAEDRLTQIETQLEGLETKLAAAAEPIKSAVTPLVEQARTQFTAVEGRVAELRNAGADQWQSIGTEITTALDNLERTISEAASKLGG